MIEFGLPTSAIEVMGTTANATIITLRAVHSEVLGRIGTCGAHQFSTLLWELVAEST